MDFIVISVVVRINTYSWGSNSNVTLGHEMSRQYPEKLKMLTHNSIRQVCVLASVQHTPYCNFMCIMHVVSEVRCDIYFLFLYQVVLCKFHTVFLSRRGEVFTCGHGRGGRLGHKTEQSIIVRSCVEMGDIENISMIIVTKNIVIVANITIRVFDKIFNMHQKLAQFKL